MYVVWKEHVHGMEGIYPCMYQFCAHKPTYTNACCVRKGLPWDTTAEQGTFCPGLPTDDPTCCCR